MWIKNWLEQLLTNLRVLAFFQHPDISHAPFRLVCSPRLPCPVCPASPGYWWTARLLLISTNCPPKKFYSDGSIIIWQELEATGASITSVMTSRYCTVTVVRKWVKSSVCWNRTAKICLVLGIWDVSIFNSTTSFLNPPPPPPPPHTHNLFTHSLTHWPVHPFIHFTPVAH